MVYCYRTGFPCSRRAAEGELSLRRDGARDSLSWMLDARLSNSCVLNFRGTPPVESRVGIPLFVCPQPMLLAICLKLVYSYNSSENEESCSAVQQWVHVWGYTYARNAITLVSDMTVREADLYRRK